MKNHRLVLRAMIVKELRTTLRERQQAWGFAITLLVLGFMSIVLTQKLQPAARAIRMRDVATSTAPTQPATRPSVTQTLSQLPWGYVDPAVIRWICIGFGTAVSLLFAMGYVISATLASFAGEKDTKTLEILLASPITDTNLFVTKCLSVLLPTCVIGYLMLLIPAGLSLVLLRREFAQVPIHVPFHVLVLSLPIILLIEASLVAIGAAISAKAETLKGASQVFGGVCFVIFFGTAYGLPVLITFTGLRNPVIALGKAWITMPFVAQYAILLAALSAVALLFFLIGRSLFRRDRLLA
ncbi:MAG: ABC transporter permease subunit [Bacillota bacterium]